MKEPVDHILRPRLPWRSPANPALTECGYDATKVKALTRDEFFARLKDFGQQRTALVTCMTCSSTARRWTTWEEDPRPALEREIQWEAAWRQSDRGTRLRDELRAIASLIAAHEDEYRAILERQAWVDRKAARSTTATPSRDGPKAL